MEIFPTGHKGSFTLRLFPAQEFPKTPGESFDEIRKEQLWRENYPWKKVSK